MRLLTILLLLVVSPAWAADPRLDQLAPQGVRRGDEVQVKLSGPRVGTEPEQLLLYEPGIEVAKLESVDKNSALATLRLTNDCPLGIHALRIRTATGLSNLVTLHVGTLSSVNEVEPNNSAEEAQSIELDRTVHGVIKPEDSDLFLIQAEKGERVSIEVEGLRLGRTQFDPLIEVIDTDQRIIASNDDQTAAHGDSFLSLIAPTTGKLLVRLREVAYRGNNQSTYLLHIGRFPRPTTASHPAVATGRDVAMPWVGDGRGLFSQSLSIDGAAGEATMIHPADELGVAPTPLPLWVAGESPTVEIEPNESKQDATPLPCPGVAAGVIGTPGDRDRYQITAKKGETLDLRVRARELRSPLDPILRVYDAKGKRLAGNDDDQRQPDSYVRFKVPADGDYLLDVEDCLKRGSPALTYVLDVARPEPVAELALEERRRYVATVIEVPQGGRTNALLRVTRRNFGGELEAIFDNLPPGVTAKCYPLAGNYNRVPVVFTATDSAEPMATLADVSVKQTDAKKTTSIDSQFEQQTWMVRGRNNVPVWSHFAKRMPVAVTKKLPFTIELAQPKAPLCLNGSSQLKVTATRDEGFDQPISVRALYHSPGFSSNRSRSIGKGKLEATIPITANSKARLGEWPMVVVGETNLNGRLYTSTQFVNVTIAEPYFDIAVPTLTALQGDPVEWTVKLSPRTSFEGTAKLDLIGLPPGVKAEPIDVTADATEATFQLVIEDDAKLGRNRGVRCRARLQVNDEPVEYQQGYAELRIDPPQEQTAARDNPQGGPAT